MEKLILRIALSFPNWGIPICILMSNITWVIFRIHITYIEAVFNIYIQSDTLSNWEFIQMLLLLYCLWITSFMVQSCKCTFIQSSTIIKVCLEKVLLTPYGRSRLFSPPLTSRWGTHTTDRSKSKFDLFLFLDLLLYHEWTPRLYRRDMSPLTLKYHS